MEEEILWAEKYRPKSLDEIVNQKEIVERLKKFVKEKNMPHLLFAGPLVQERQLQHWHLSEIFMGTIIDSTFWNLMQAMKEVLMLYEIR